jgi:hypothetical protein
MSEQWAKDQTGGVIPAHFVLGRIREIPAALRDEEVNRGNTR